MRVGRSFSGACIVAVAGLAAACGSSGGSVTSSSGGGSSAKNAKPITIGASLSLSGDFAADGQAFEPGYKLWAADVNAKGGLLGHKVKLQVVSDSSRPDQVVSNYQKLIGSNHDALVFGPFSTLLTVPSSKIANRYGYAFVEGAGGGPAGFATGLKHVFDVSIPVKDNLIAFAQYIAGLPPGQRPRTAAYPTVNEQFTEPQIPVARKIMEAAGIKTVYSKVFPAEVTDFSPIAGQVAAAHPDAVVLGAVDVPTVSSFVHTFIQQHFNPKAFIATACTDQGAAFVKAVGKSNENGIVVPNDWFGGVPKARSPRVGQEH